MENLQKTTKPCFVVDIMRLIKFTNEEKWNEIVFSLPDYHYLQTKEWGDFKNNYGWRPLRYLIVDEYNKTIGAIQILKKRTILGKNILYSPKGPLLEKFYVLNQNFWENLKKELKKIALENKAFLVKIEPQVETIEISNAGFITSKNIQLTNCTIINNLELSEEEILKKMRKNARYNIRLAQKSNVIIKEDNSLEGIENFLSLYYIMGKRTGFFLRNKNYMVHLLKYFIEKGQAKIFLAQYQEKFLASAVIFIFPPWAWYVFGGSVRDNKNLMPSYLLQFEIIKKLKSLGIKHYDLGGVPCLKDKESQKFMSGLYTFKSHFGGAYKEFLGSFDIPTKKFYYKVWGKIEPFMKKYYRLFKKDLFY